MQTNLKEFIAKLFYFVKWIAYFLPFYIFNYLTWIIFGFRYEFIPRFTIDLKNTKYNLITFKLWELTFNNFKDVIEYLSDGGKYIYIFNYKGELVASFNLNKHDIENISYIYIMYKINGLRKMIIFYCNNYISLSAWSILTGDDIFYMHISDKNISP